MCGGDGRDGHRSHLGERGKDSTVSHPDDEEAPDEARQPAIEEAEDRGCNDDFPSAHGGGGEAEDGDEAEVTLSSVSMPSILVAASPPVRY